MASSACEINRNPFTNPLIINKILQLSSFKELKCLREVNKSFRDLSTSYLKQKAWIHLNNKSLGVFLKFFSMSPDDNYASSNSIPATFICKRFYLSYVTLDFGKPKTAESDINLFFTNFGPFIEEIVLEKCAFVTYFFTLTSLLEFVPNLECISIGSPKVLDTNAPAGVDAFDEDKIFSRIKYLEIVPDIKFNCLSITNWTSTFKMLPGLKSLNLQCRNSTDISTVLSSLNSTITNMNNFSEFSCFLTELKEQELNLLIELNTQFTNLDLNLSSDITTQKLKQLLNNSWNSLEILKLFHGILPTTTTTFPIVEFKQGFPYSIQLPALKNLTLIGDMVQSLDFLRLLPNLDSLSVLDHKSCQTEIEEEEETLTVSDLVKNTFWQKNDKDLIKHLNLKYLSMEYSLKSICTEKLSIIIPNLKILSIYFDNNSLRTVFKYLSGLEEIHILGSEVTDEGITGISMIDLLTDGLEIAYSKVIENKRAFNYIGDCNGLKKFTMPPIPQPNISDFSVNYGFLDTKSLRIVKLPMTSITDEGMKLMEENMHLVNLNCKYFVEDGEIFTRS